MNKIFEGKKIILVGGPGGVGKTTLAAALGIQCACSGFRTVVLTVDPAQRLGQALGFTGFETEVQPVRLPNFPEAQLHASMLDSRRYFDKVIERFANTPSQKEKILASSIYRTMVNSLGGTHEYAAMERLLEFVQLDRYERIIVDTPPTQNAVDLISAPQRLADFMDNSVLTWFQGPKPAYLRWFRQGTRLAMKMLQLVFGSEFLESFAKLVDDFEGMQAGFQKRNLQVVELLRQKDTAFVLATFPSEARFLESVSFVETLAQNGISLSGLVLNRVEPVSLNELPANLSMTLEVEVKHQIEAILSYQRSLYERQKYWVERFSRQFSLLPIVPIPKQSRPLHDIASLSHLGSFLVS